MSEEIADLNYWLILCNPNKWFDEGSSQNAEVNNLLYNLEYENWRVSERYFKNAKVGDRGIIKVGKDSRNKKSRTLSNGNVVDLLDAGIYAFFEIIKDDSGRVTFYDNDNFRVNLKVYNNLFSKSIIIGEEDSKKLLSDKYNAQSSVKLDKEIFLKVEKFIEDKKSSVVSCKTENALNQILYGPPGTGKTYNTINKALEIIDDEFYQKNKEETKDNRKALKNKFDQYQKEGKIEFVTFHQSYGYEEFVEGIKAGITEKENIKYEVKPGIFKELCQKASQKNEFTEDINNIDFNDYLTIGQNFETKHGKKFTITDINEDISFEQGNGTHNALRKTILELLEDEEIMLSDEYYSSQVYIAREIYKQLNKNEGVTKNYILIIDEINRGNISKIFGELITIIEPSKRIDASEEIRVKLPYSDNIFGVPSNLYIIGTMNTADRSIAQIDTALRRRFVFEEMMPKPELLVFDDKEKGPLVIENNDEKVEVQKILEAINERIEYIYDREHTIGHSYFMPLIKTPTKDKLDEIFRVNIIPLLAEYFYGDWNDIKIILNDTKDEGKFITKRKKSKYSIADTKKNNQIFTVNQDNGDSKGFSMKGYKKIYKAKDEEKNLKEDNQDNHEK